MELQEPLNQAHRYQRQAEKDVLCGRYADALRFYEKAGENYGKSVVELKNCSPLVLETLLEQKKFSLHQVEVISLRLKQLTTFHNQKILSGAFCLSNLDVEDRLMEEKIMHERGSNQTLKTTILQKLDQHDTLLEQLNLSTNDKNVAAECEQQQVLSKQPKTDCVVIEELRQCNAELRGFIVQLLEELDRKTVEIEKLKAERRERRSSSSIPTIINDDVVVDEHALPEFVPLELPDYASDSLKG